MTRQVFIGYRRPRIADHARIVQLKKAKKGITRESRRHINTDLCRIDSRRRRKKMSLCEFEAVQPVHLASRKIKDSLAFRLSNSWIICNLDINGYREDSEKH